MPIIEDFNSVYELYEKLSVRADSVYKFVSLYSDYINSARDYGDGNPINMLEVHVLTNITDHPGITATELTDLWGKTKGAISQTVKKLVAKGYIYRGIKQGNSKIIPLFPTVEGEKLANAHKVFDVLDITETMQSLQEKCSLEEISNFYKVLDVYINLFQDNK